jgi:GNAT superfamily N-acetyltransferase
MESSQPNHQIMSEITVHSFGPDSPLYADFVALAAALNSDDPTWRPSADPLPRQKPVCFMVVRDGAVVARGCVVENRELDEGWVGVQHRSGPTDEETLNGHPALLGWYECIDDPSAAAALFDAIFDHCRRHGFTSVIGPMNGSTWHRYRFAEPSTNPPFFLDVHNPPWYIEQWEASGFSAIARYYSTRLDGVEQDLDEHRTRLADIGITIRSFDVSHFEYELHLLYTLSVAGFRSNYLYTDIGYDEFAEIYRPVQPLVRPEFVLIAEDAEGEGIGYVFAIDNLYERQKRSLVMKSAAVLPEQQGNGLGHLLLASVHQAAFERGYSEIIHALMSEGNRSTRILSHQSQPYRSYRLFGRDL